MDRNKLDDSRMYSKDPGRRESNPTKTFTKEVLKDYLKSPVNCLKTLRYMVSIGVPDENPVFQVVRDKIVWYIDEEKGHRLKALDDMAFTPDYDDKVKRVGVGSVEYRERCAEVLKQHDYNMGRGKSEDFVGELSWGSGKFQSKESNRPNSTGGNKRGKYKKRKPKVKKVESKKGEKAKTKKSKK